MDIKLFYDEKKKTLSRSGILMRVVFLQVLLTSSFIGFFNLKLIGEDMTAVLITLSWIVLGPALFFLTLYCSPISYMNNTGGVFVLYEGRLYCQYGTSPDTERNLRNITRNGFEGFICGGYRVSYYGSSGVRHPYGYVPVKCTESTTLLGFAMPKTIMVSPDYTDYDELVALFDGLSKSRDHDTSYSDIAVTRDGLKPAEYWKKYLIRQDNRYKQFYNLAVQMEQEEKALAPAEFALRERKHITAMAGWMNMQQITEEMIFALYSYGAGISIVEGKFRSWLVFFYKRESYTYSDILLLFSWLVLFDCGKETLEKALSLWESLGFDNESYLYCKPGAQGMQDTQGTEDAPDARDTPDAARGKAGSNDRLLAFLSNYMKQKATGSLGASDVSGIPVLFESGHGDLSRILLLKNKDEQVKAFAGFMRNRWYDSNKVEGWYDTHKNKFDIYVGYWAFECAAVAKALGFQADDVSGLPYFPMELFSYSSVGQ